MDASREQTVASSGEPLSPTEHGRGAAIVTGGTSGIGLAIAQQLAGAGWPVAVFGAHNDEAGRRPPRASEPDTSTSAATCLRKRG
jgi:NAD(P)-dependent dehydrogenase (short-subunit alcohol dehydrogenase family)